MSSCSSNTSIVATLQPIHNAQQEDLIPNIPMRPSLKIRHDSSATLHLGRNVSTGIAFGEIPRKAATVLFKKSGKFHLERHSSHVSVIRRDGSVVPLSGPLEHDDVVRLYKQDYAYRVQLSTETENTTTKENSMVFQETGEECACAVCMEIIVNATALVPCGHLFCKDCLNNISECPNCRLPVQSKLPIKTMDNVIGKLVTAGNVFSEEDVQHYASRTKPPDVVVAPPRPPKRARRTNVNVVSVDLTLPQVGDTAEDAIVLC